MLRTPPRRDKPKEGKRVTQFAKRIELKELQSPSQGGTPHRVAPVVRTAVGTIRGTQVAAHRCSTCRHEKCGRTQRTATGQFFLVISRSSDPAPIPTHFHAYRKVRKDLPFLNLLHLPDKFDYLNFWNSKHILPTWKNHPRKNMLSPFLHVQQIPIPLPSASGIALCL